MKIAVTYAEEKIFQHFGHTEKFKLYDTEDGIVNTTTVIDTNGSGHGALAEFLKEHEVDTLICGGIGAGASAALDKAGIRLYGGVSGLADKAIEALLDGTLVFDSKAKCSHHGDGHHCGGHASHDQ